MKGFLKEALYRGYVHQQGDHWIDYPLRAFEGYMKESKECSYAFHMLYGIMRGIKDGHITKGNIAYQVLADNATADTARIPCFFQVQYMASFGLFVNCELGGRALDEFRATFGREAPPRRPAVKPTYKSVWAPIYRMLKDYTNSSGEEDCVRTMQTWMAPVESGLLTHGDPKFLEIAIEASKTIPEPSDKYVYDRVFRLLGRTGIFGTEALRGCEPYRSQGRWAK